LAQEIGASPAQLAIAWVAAQGKDIVPLVGARSRNRLTESLATSELRLSESQLSALAEAMPEGQVAGARYPEAILAHLDSEKEPHPINES
jgi:aryl-alcohol dehydrogenase-like predicted oxidoreductase